MGAADEDEVRDVAAEAYHEVLYHNQVCRYTESGTLTGMQPEQHAVRQCIAVLWCVKHWVSLQVRMRRGNTTRLWPGCLCHDVYFYCLLISVVAFHLPPAGLLRSQASEMDKHSGKQ